MQVEAYRFTVNALESHYSKKFAPSEAARSKLLNTAFNEMKGCSNSALEKAADSIMLNKPFLPALQSLIDEVKKHALADAKTEDKAQEKRAGSYERYGDHKREEMTAGTKALLHNGLNLSRKDFYKAMVLMKKEFPDANYDPGDYLVMLDKQKTLRPIDMDATVGTGALGLFMAEED